MHHLSMAQALTIWSELEDTLRGEHSFGGDVAEIYVYRVMARDPLVEAHLKEPSLWGPGAVDMHEALRQANESFHDLLVLFAKLRAARIEIEVRENESVSFRELGAWLKEHEQAHRWHIRIRPVESR